MAALGCKSFAMLFDDIDSEMLLVDAKEFPSFAHAQVIITNEVYTHLGKPAIFLFCPTGKFPSRAKVSTSPRSICIMEYLFGLLCLSLVPTYVVVYVHSELCTVSCAQ